MAADKYKIKKVRAREILDSRGNPTLEACVLTGAGEFCAGVPSGASTGAGEAVELRDGGEKFGGLGVAKAAANVNGVINPEIIGMDCRDQEAADEKMREIDATPNKSRLGANAICGVSLACARRGGRAKETAV